MNVGCGSIVGKTRERDEDGVFVATMELVAEDRRLQRLVAAVADGMGGIERGEVASRLAIGQVAARAHKMLSAPASDSSEVDGQLRGIVTDANAAIRRNAADQKVSEMGTTLTMVYVSDSQAFVANVGDSRTFLFRGGEVEARTKDHSFVQQLVDRGVLREEEKRTHPKRNLVTRALGLADEVEPDLYHWNLFQGDSLLLCCDGLWEALDEKELGMIIQEPSATDELVARMLARADQADGSDNVSAVLVRGLSGPSKLEVITRKTVVFAPPKVPETEEAPSEESRQSKRRWPFKR